MSSAVNDEGQFLVDNKAPDASKLINTGAPMPASKPFYKKKGFLIGSLIVVVVCIIIIIVLVVGHFVSSSSDDGKSTPTGADDPVDPTEVFDVKATVSLNAVDITVSTTSESMTCD